MQHDPTTSTQEQLLFEEELAHEFGVLLRSPEDEGAAGDDDPDEVVYPYAYALEAVVT